MTLNSSNRRLGLAALLLFAMTASTSAWADSLTVAWTANPERAVVGYVVYVGPAPDRYVDKFDVGSGFSFTYSDAVPGQRYCFAVAAYAAGRLQGPKSPATCGYSDAPPALVNPGSQTSSVGQLVALELSARDPLGQSVSYAATGLPPGLMIRPSTGLITGAATRVGTYDVTATASDGALIDSESFTWTVREAGPDTTPPEVRVTDPTAGASFAARTSTVTVGGSASDASGVTLVTWTNDRGGSGTASGTTAWTASAIALKTGANVITIRARDTAGNTAIASLMVTYALPDQTPPAVVISAPTSGSTYTTSADSISMSGTASDTVGVAQVTWTNDRGGSGTAMGTTSWNIGSVPLQGGVNTITVTARDAAGNKAIDVLSIDYTAAPLTLVSFVSDRQPPQAARTPITWTATVAGGQTPYQYKWLVYDGSDWSILRDWSEAKSYTWIPTRRNGAYKIRVRVRNARSTLDSVLDERTAQDGKVSRTATFPIVAATREVQLLGIVPDKPGPQVAGTAITFTAAATGGTGTYQYKWWVLDGRWLVLRDWASSNTYTWVPTAGKPYLVAVWVRESTSTVDAPGGDAANGSVEYTIVAPRGR